MGGQMVTSAWFVDFRIGKILPEMPDFQNPSRANFTLLFNLLPGGCSIVWSLDSRVVLG